MNPPIQNTLETSQGNFDPRRNQKSKLLLSVEKIKEIATREQLASDGGGTGRSDTNDNSLNTV